MNMVSRATDIWNDGFWLNISDVIAIMNFRAKMMSVQYQYHGRNW